MRLKIGNLASVAACVCLIILKFVGAINESGTYIYVHSTTLQENESNAALCPTSECYTLQEISETHTFTSNTTLVLLPGVHSITTNTSLNIENVENIVISGYANSGNTNSDQKVDIPVIQCSSYQTFMVNLKNITGLLLSRFEMNGCFGYGPEALFSYPQFNDAMPKQQNMSIFVGNSSNIVIEGIGVYHSSGVGLWLKQVYGNIEIQNSAFSHNIQDCMLELTTWDTTLSALGNTSIFLTIANTVFSFSKGNAYFLGGISIRIAAAQFQIHIDNVIVRNDDVEGGLMLNLASSFEATSLLEIKRLKILSSINNKGKLLKFYSLFADQVNCIHFGGLNFKSLRGMMNVNISDSNFTGPSSCVTLMSSGHRFIKILLSKTNFSYVHCQCGPLNIENVYDITLRDITTENSLQPLKIRQSNVTLEKNCSFVQNGGGLLLIEGSTLFVGYYSDIQFRDNECLTSHIHCPIFEAESSRIVIFKTTSVVFRNNTGTGILVLHQSKLIIFGNTNLTFDSNSGKDGGALSLYARSQVEICTGDFYEEHTYFDIDDYYFYHPPLFNVEVEKCMFQNKYFLFVSNHAMGKGGAIFIDDSSYYSPLVGLEQFQLNAFEAAYADNTLFIYFINNTADIAGSALYGGWFIYTELTNDHFNDTVHFDEQNDDLSTISSNPVRVCVCNSSLPDCDVTEYRIETFPGRTVHVDVVAVGQRYGTVPSIVHTELMSNRNNSETTLNEGEYIQEVNRNCTTLHYTSSSVRKFEKMILTVDKENTPNLDKLQEQLKSNSFLFAEIGILKEQLSVLVTFSDCPLGFSLNFASKKCSCHPILHTYKIFDCNIDLLKIMKPSEKWINATFIHNLENDTGVIVSDHCPFDYCKQNSSHVSLDLESPDNQCQFDRSGILCGGCINNFSHVLGSSKCKKCSSLWTILLVPVIAIVGIILVISMLGLNLTVSTGMVNGLILYANIIRANNSTFLQPNTFLSYFIAWMNLDLGIEMCLYNGLDAYVKTWLQFIFPLYIWTIMIILIALSRRYVFVVRLCGSNVVQVLATLFLLSYAKLIRIIITIFQFTTLVYPDGYKRRVWLYDGNVDYLKGKHIPLFIAGLTVLLCLSIPYTVSLLFIQWLRKFNHHRLLRWVGKLKPLFDAYTGPFKEKHVYWFGVLLLVRVALYLVFSLNVSGDTSLNLMAIGTTTLFILCYLVLVGGIYESTLVNIADSSFLLNLGIVTMGTHFYNSPHEISTISVGIAFCQFILIALYHLYLRITETTQGRHLNEKLQKKLKQISTPQRVKLMRNYLTPGPPIRTHRDISHSSIKLKEPLLADVIHEQN